MDRCTSCIMPRSTHSIRFDGDTCNLCSANKRKITTQVAPNDLDYQIEQIRGDGQGRSFDCLVGVSGGRDSAYLLYQLVKRHDLRCLAAYHRTPFTPDVIDANVRRLAEKLNVPLVEMDISREYHRKIARNVILLWLKNPLPVIANLACAPCKQHSQKILQIAEKHNIRYVVMGGNKYEAFQLSSGYHDDMAANISSIARIKQLLMLLKKGGLALTKSIELWRFLAVGIRSVLYVSPDSPYLRFRYAGVITFNYFYHTGWNEMECEGALSELGWELPPNCSSSWRADCVFTEVKNYMFKKMTGVTYMDAFFSTLVREGVLSRNEALQRLKIEGKPSLERLAEACNIMELPTDVFT